MFLPKNICTEETLKLREGIYFDFYADKMLHMLNLADKGWTFFVVAQTRGRCYYELKTITIPYWAVAKASTFKGRMRLVQYILHEISHALVIERHGLAVGRAVNHGKEFMDILIEICPPELLIYEMTYKPRQLVKAGVIFCPDSLDF